MSEKRWCYYIPPGAYEEGQGYIPSIVTEGEPGHSPLTGNGPHSAPWYWGKTFQAANAFAAKANAERGLTPEDVTKIIASSIEPTGPIPHPAGTPGRRATALRLVRRMRDVRHPSPAMRTSSAREREGAMSSLTLYNVLPVPPPKETGARLQSLGLVGDYLTTIPGVMAWQDEQGLDTWAWVNVVGDDEAVPEGAPTLTVPVSEKIYNTFEAERRQAHQ